MRKGCDLQTHTRKPIALDLSTALGMAVPSNKSSKPVKPPSRSARLRRSAFASCSALFQQKAAASLPSAQSTGCNRSALSAIPVTATCCTKRRGCCSVAAGLRWEPANDLSTQREPWMPWSKLPLWSCPLYINAQRTTQHSFCMAREHNS